MSVDLMLLTNILSSVRSNQLSLRSTLPHKQLISGARVSVNKSCSRTHGSGGSNKSMLINPYFSRWPLITYLFQQQAATASAPSAKQEGQSRATAVHLLGQQLSHYNCKRSGCFIRCEEFTEGLGDLRGQLQ
jgi:hypothetical protein